METWMIVAIVVIALLIVAAVAWMLMQRKQSTMLRERFGSEYDETTSAAGRRQGEKVLREREERVQKLHIRELTNEELETFGRDWRNVQNHFVDDPEKCVIEADTLVQKVMDARGYPLTGFDRQAEDISVDHPQVVSNYRAAHEIAEASRHHEATTEDLRQAMIHYRALFSDLLGSGRPIAKAS
jgi:hypothetical protein